MLLIWYKFRHKHNTMQHNTMQTFQSNQITLRVSLVDGTIKWRIMLNLCTSHCTGAPSVSQIISYLYTWYTLEKLREWSTYDKRTPTWYQVKTYPQHTQSALSEYKIETGSNTVWQNDHNSQHYIILSKKV